jgi:GNAT superfamily N-acetyltransferase
MDALEVKYVNTVSPADLNRLRKSAGWNELSPRQAETGLANSAFVTAAAVNGTIVGMARVISDGAYIAYIADVLVLPEYQGRGIGRELMNRVMLYIKGNAVAGEKVYVNLMAAKGKEGFYKRFGFIERPSEQHGAGMNLWLACE